MVPAHPELSERGSNPQGSLVERVVAIRFQRYSDDPNNQDWRLGQCGTAGRCKDDGQPCHGDILLKYANSAKQDLDELA